MLGIVNVLTIPFDHIKAIPPFIHMGITGKSHQGKTNINFVRETFTIMKNHVLRFSVSFQIKPLNTHSGKTLCIFTP